MTANRWCIYQRERFPVLAHGLLIAAFSSSAVSFSCLLRGGHTLPSAASLLTAFATAFILFLQLRIADEFKDFDEDSRYRPYRPVPRGLVKLRELAAIGAVGALMQLGLALWLSPRLALLLWVTWAYLALMTREFFVRDWIRERPIAYLWTHMLIIPLTDFYATACDWQGARVAPPAGLFWFIAVSFFNGITLEVGRKIRAPGDEEEGVRTYSHLWGQRNAALIWLAALLVTAACAVAASVKIGCLHVEAPALALLLGVALVLVWQFLAKPVTGRARLLEHFSGAWTLILYLSLGVIPLLWKLKEGGPMSFIFRLGDALRGAQLGGKAGSLAALHGSGLSIPQWFVILPHAFEASLSEADRRALSEGDERTDTQTILAQIQPASSVMREFNGALVEFFPAGELVAVRSSALDEDGGDHSFAGQLESYLMVRAEEVAGRVASVWKSAFSARVRAYRAQHQLSAAPRPPAVLIQRMIHAEVAGVAFGADPIRGRQDLAVVSAVHGFGTALVNGESDADLWHVDGSGDIVQRQLANKCFAHHADDGECRGATVMEGDPPRPALDDVQVRAVAELVRRSGEVFGRPQDIEWAIEKGRLYLLQSRPITAIPQRGKLNIWDNSNIIESYSGVTLPLTFSFARRAYAGVYRQFCLMLAVPKAKIAAHDNTFHHMLGLIRGRVYYNLLNWYRVLALLPGFTLNRRFMEQMMGVKEELPEEVLAALGHASVSDRLKDGFDLAFSLAALVANHFLLPRKIRRFYGRLNEALALPHQSLEVMTADHLSTYFLQLEKKLLTRWDAPLLNDFFAMIFYGVLRRLTGQWAEDAVGTLQNDLLCGGGGMISAEPAARIRELAELALANDGMVKQLCDGPLAAILSRMEQVPKFKSAYLEYLARFGDRCLEELKLESLTLHDDPMRLLRSVGQLARSRASGAAARAPVGEVDARRKAEARIAQAPAWHPLRRVLFRWVLRHARARVQDRENLRFERTRLFGRVRRVFVELGRRLHAEGLLLDPRDVFFLEVDEVLGFIAGTAATARLKDLVALRQTEFAEYRASEPPPNRFMAHGVVNRGTSWPGIQPAAPNVAGQQRKGVGCCPGVVRGRVHKIADPQNALIQAGEVLVAERTDPGWIMLFPAAAGLLVERGSLLSHSAIVARELGIPAIVSIEGLTGWLNDGDQVEFDGSTGMVRRIETVEFTAMAS